MGRPFMVMKSELKSPNTRPNLPRMSSSESGFFFCGIKLEPLVTPSPSSSQPNSSLEYKIQSSESRLRCSIVVDAAPDLCEIREQVVCPQDRLRAAQVLIARNHRRRIALRAIEHRPHQPTKQSERTIDFAAQPQPHIERYLLIAAAAGVDLLRQ